MGILILKTKTTSARSWGFSFSIGGNTDGAVVQNQVAEEEISQIEISKNIVAGRRTFSLHQIMM